MIVVAQLLLLVLIANGAPVIARYLFGRRWDRALDGGRRFVDGRPWLGPSKTIRGITAALLCTSAVAVVIGLPASIGLQVALGAMLGDLLSNLGVPLLAAHMFVFYFGMMSMVTPSWAP